jgi:hypothetical protein
VLSVTQPDVLASSYENEPLSLPLLLAFGGVETTNVRDTVNDRSTMYVRTDSRYRIDLAVSPLNLSGLATPATERVRVITPAVPVVSRPTVDRSWPRMTGLVTALDFSTDATTTTLTLSSRSKLRFA